MVESLTTVHIACGLVVPLMTRRLAVAGVASGAQRYVYLLFYCIVSGLAFSQLMTPTPSTMRQ
jgi:hypothetical protein